MKILAIPEIAVITGPTATGKTALGAALAKALGGEVVSADSMQIYKHMDIGTAKPAAEETLGVPHHMLDIISPWEDYSAAKYVEDAARCVRDILCRGRLPVIVGGTGLYIDSLISGRIFAAESDAELRDALGHEYDTLGGETMLKKLAGFDGERARKLCANDKRRIIRAFEVYRLTGRTISQHDAESRGAVPAFSAVKIALTFRDRNDLYERIGHRVDRMLCLGLVDEVRGLLDMGVSRNSTAMQAIGYKETAAAVLGEISMSDAVDKIKMESRRYAKRQLSWLRRDETVKWITWEKTPDLASGLSISTSYLHKA